MANLSDDDEGAVKTRLGLFKQNTLPMLKYLDDKGKLRVVSIKEVDKLVRLLGNWSACGRNILKSPAMAKIQANSLSLSS